MSRPMASNRASVHNYFLLCSRGPGEGRVESFGHVKVTRLVNQKYNLTPFCSKQAWHFRRMAMGREGDQRQRVSPPQPGFGCAISTKLVGRVALAELSRLGC
jgi:hypothetical protein